MQVTYIKHSGFAVELEDCILLFDYWEGMLPAFTPEKPLFVFASHSHFDHFNRNIFAIFRGRPNTCFILSDDISVSDALSKEYAGSLHLVSPNKRLSAVCGAVQIDIQTLRSTDLGVAFIVRCGNKTIYHAGDLHCWAWNGAGPVAVQKAIAALLHEIEPLRTVKIDAAFLPLDPRQEELFYFGFDSYMHTADIKYAFPMHFWKDFSVIERLAKMPVASPYRDKIISITREGETFNL